MCTKKIDHVALSNTMWILQKDLSTLRTRYAANKTLMLGEKTLDALTQGERFPVVFQNAMTTLLNRSKVQLPRDLYICQPRDPQVVSSIQTTQIEAEATANLLSRIIEWMDICIKSWNQEDDVYTYNTMLAEMSRVMKFY
jgi:hypothetical protein